MAKVIGVAGVIGAGKSVVRQLLATLYNFPTYDCDAQAKALYYTPKVRQEVKTLFGEDPIDAEGALRKDFLRRLLSEPTTKLQLEKLVHSAVDEHFAQWKQKNSNAEMLVAESAIMYTSGFERFCDYVISVQADKGVRQQRVLERDTNKGVGYFAQVNQLQQKELQLQQANANACICNNGNEPVVEQVEHIIKSIRDNV